ncbi:MAG: type II/IV secretion system ATPase subunit [Candidatus Thorarchaeota archaeon]|nr:type II/IV secretion system ATPase subunit [Candidatus Thorarchaeota archaeon]
MKQNVNVIHCSSGRCDRCSERAGESCQKLRELGENPDCSVLLLESNSGLIHFNIAGSPIPNQPPWVSDRWETVFIGQDDDLFSELDFVAGAYCVGPYLSLFSKQSGDYQVRYTSLPIVRTSLELALLNQLVNENRIFFKNSGNSREKLTEQQTRLMLEISEYIKKHIPEINENTRTRLSQIAAHQRNVLGPLFPLLMDESIEEIYLDRPRSTIYFDHQELGRCNTSFTYNEKDVSRIITFMRSESNLHLDRSNPSLKMDLDVLGNRLRLSASVPPLSLEGVHLEIRRARRKPFTLYDLIDNDTITYEASAILLLAIASRLNITITGGPGTGKTTLLNALDMTTPRIWRKIYVEDAIESRLLMDHHQVKLQVDPVDESHRKLSKSDEIIKCLHRSPDYLILGEIQTIEHSKALFQAIAAGLKSVQTCHSNSASNLISRWIWGHGIERSNLAMMDLIVTLERPIPGQSLRRVSEIVEIRRGKENGLQTFLGTNTIYDGEELGDWADDGAFMIHARNAGIENLDDVMNALISSLQNQGNYANLETLSEILWSYGHPMKFTG